MTTLLTAKINTVLGSQSNHSYKAKEQSGLYEFQCGVILQFELTLKVHQFFLFFFNLQKHTFYGPDRQHGLAPLKQMLICLGTNRKDSPKKLLNISLFVDEDWEQLNMRKKEEKKKVGFVPVQGPDTRFVWETASNGYELREHQGEE